MDLVHGIPAIVVFPETNEELPEQIIEYQGRMDDAYWSYQLRRPFSWSLYRRWWIARRWVIPRDIRKE